MSLVGPPTRYAGRMAEAPDSPPTPPTAGPGAPAPPTAPQPPAAGWRRHAPNALTLARLALTVVFVVVLTLYEFPDVNAWALPVALVVFVVAALTDALDGYLARRWNVITVFGRIMDPFADKLLVLGAFVMLAGVEPSGVTPWMLVIILGRELLVTTIRGVLEGRGIDFSAALSGKLKMVAQSVGVPVILLLVMVVEADGASSIASRANQLIALAVTLITALSAWPYIVRAVTALRKPPDA